MIVYSYKINVHMKINDQILKDKEAQYDMCAKRILAQKDILAHILVNCIKEFKDLNPREVVKLIEGEPMIEVPIDAGFTNSSIHGFNNEDSQIYEGLVRYDVIFYVRVKNSLSKIIVNIEAQKSEPSRYKILNRAIFYVCRLISSQKERDFIGSNYDDIKQVYSIWICMNMNQNSLNHIHLIDDRLFGDYSWKGNIDLFNIMLIGLANDVQEYSINNDVHRLLGTLFSSKLNANEKISIIESEYDISFKDGLREEVNVMCNLGEGIAERAMERAEKEKIEAVRKAKIEAERIANETVALNMYELGYTYAQISDVTKLSVDDVKAIINQHCLN